MWKDFFNSGGADDQDYLVIRFIPYQIEVGSFAHKIAFEPRRWAPAVLVRKHAHTPSSTQTQTDAHVREWSSADVQRFLQSMQSERQPFYGKTGEGEHSDDDQDSIRSIGSDDDECPWQLIYTSPVDPSLKANL